CTRILRRAAEIVGSGCLISGRQIMVTPAFLERFLEEVRTAHDRVMEQMETGFPAEPCKGCRCRDCDYRSVCMGENIGAEGSE
ncbi:MAG: PD-(D/E)XK nuclease family protein, partial [Thermoplasmatales archaeon]|nr:PD-(D/E)XK nuclease family protein [Thermoplasmatales archaeon]